MLISRILRLAGLAHLVMVALALTVLLSEPTIRRYGDNLQIALPVLAWGCAATKGGGAGFAARFAAMFTTAHASKLALGDAALNQRPNGADKGFPSAHTAAAAIGASRLARDCLTGSPVAAPVVILAAAFVGGSRIEVAAHDIWQVLAGGVLGLLCDRLALSRAARQRLRAGLLQGVQAARRLGRRAAAMPRRALGVSIAALATFSLVLLIQA